MIAESSEVIGVWRSLVARLIWDQEVASSSLVTPSLERNVIVFLVRIDRGCYNNISGVDYA